MRQSGARVNRAFTTNGHVTNTVQAGTPMTVTENGTLLLERGRGVFMRLPALILCPQISREVNWPQAKRRAAPSCASVTLRRVRA
jgi:hypothetical protein